MKILVVYVQPLEFHGQEAGHALPLAEDHHLAVGALQDIADDIHRLANLHVIARLLVEDIGTVAYHAHDVEIEQQLAPVRL